jgi:geranylgeranyl pyrophosphate synthase
MKTNKEIQLLNELRTHIEKEILKLPPVDKIPLFYKPIYYINNLSGKKLRPLITVISGLTVGGEIDHLIYPASAIELLHNFSLVHDDIMDNDDTRRGQPTVHVKWDVGTAILAGDGLLGLAYKKLLKTPGTNNEHLVNIFTDAMLEICEGQAIDKTFENFARVSEDAYFEMISKKTATLIKLSCEMGAIVGGGSKEEINTLASIGYKIGMGFQIQDDLLDILADEKKLGKKVGSDLERNKKTIVSIKLAEKIDQPLNKKQNIGDFKDLLNAHGIISEITQIVNSYFKEVDSLLKTLPQNKYRNLMHLLMNDIQNREM